MTRVIGMNKAYVVNKDSQFFIFVGVSLTLRLHFSYP